ncbi:Myb-like DNA-binding protein [Globisporangium polare]
MTISSAVQSQFFQQGQQQQQLIRLPLTTYYPRSLSPSGSSSSARRSTGLKAAARATANSKPKASVAKRNGKPWTPEEHSRFLEALETFPSGPWKLISAHVTTRTTRQTMTHAQKYREKIARRNRAQDLDAILLDRGSGAPCKVRARKGLTQASEDAEGDSEANGDKDQCILGEDAVKVESRRDEDVHMMELTMKKEVEDPAHHLEDGSVRAAIAALLDEYEPFDVLNDDVGSAFCHAWFQ